MAKKPDRLWTAIYHFAAITTVVFVVATLAFMWGPRFLLS